VSGLRRTPPADTCVTLHAYVYGVMTLRLLLAAGLLAPCAIAWAQGFDVPAPRGFVNDFARVIDNVRADTILRIVQYVRTQSGGEIAVVTLRDLGGRDANDIALRIGREWGVGLSAEVGDRARNAGVVILVVPKETSADNRGFVAIQVGQGAEGFIPDGVAGAIWREALPLLQQADYGGAMALMTYRVAARYAAEFGFSLDSAGVASPPVRAPARRNATRTPAGAIVLVIFLVFIVAIAGGINRSRGARRGGGMDALDWLVMAETTRRGGRGRSSGWGGGGFGGFGGGGGGFGGGFGGFGGGGGFSGGGSGGSW